MRSAQLASLAIALLTAGGCERNTLATSPHVDSVAVMPEFRETLDSSMAQIGMNGGVGIDGGFDWHFEGGGIDGTSFAVGSMVVLHLRSRFYDQLDTSFVAEGNPVIWVQRLIPKVLRAQWSADFTGPTVRLEVYAPHGLAAVTITSASVYTTACWLASPICWPIINAYYLLDGSWHPDSTGWVQLTGSWSSWPSGPPPDGYGSPGLNKRTWQASVDVLIADDLGHTGNGGCGGVWLPSPQVEMEGCGTVFQQ
jgi:hypothetical protein